VRLHLAACVTIGQFLGVQGQRQPVERPTGEDICMLHMLGVGALADESKNTVKHWSNCRLRCFLNAQDFRCNIIIIGDILQHECVSYKQCFGECSCKLPRSLSC